jgi:hypothetical protein
MNLSAFDIDEQQNFRYYLISEMRSHFTINSLTGAIRINKPLDREVSDIYKLLIDVYDVKKSKSSLHHQEGGHIVLVG